MSTSSQRIQDRFLRVCTIALQMAAAPSVITWFNPEQDGAKRITTSYSIFCVAFAMLEYDRHVIKLLNPRKSDIVAEFAPLFMPEQLPEQLQAIILQNDVTSLRLNSESFLKRVKKFDDWAEYPKAMQKLRILMSEYVAPAVVNNVEITGERIEKWCKQVETR